MDSKKLDKAIDEAYKKAGHNAYFGNGFIAGMEYATDQLQQNKCGSCKHWTRGEIYDSESGETRAAAMGECAVSKMIAYWDDTETAQDKIHDSLFGGCNLCTHENFGCIHFAQKDETQ